MPEVLALLEFDGGLGLDPQPFSSEGLLGASLWTGLGGEETTLTLLHFADSTSGDAHLRARFESERGIEETSAPREVHHIEVGSHQGRSLESPATDGYLTVVRHVASPGYAEEAGRWIDETLEGIETLEGYAGHLRGINLALPDEIWTLVLWSSPPVLPPPSADLVTNVAHYRRIRSSGALPRATNDVLPSAPLPRSSP